MAKIDDVQIPSLLFSEGSAPSTPASGFGRIYVKTTGLFFIGDNGVEVGPLAAAVASATGTVIGRAKARHSTTQSTTSGSAAAMLFDEETYDSGTIHSTASNTSRFVAPTGTTYARVHAAITMPVSNNATRHQVQAYCRIDGTTDVDPFVREHMEASGGSIRTLQITQEFAISPASYLEVMILQASTVNQSFGHATDSANNRVEVVFFN
jgi:hypothetical protein